MARIKHPPYDPRPITPITPAPTTSTRSTSEPPNQPSPSTSHNEIDRQLPADNSPRSPQPPLLLPTEDAGPKSPFIQTNDDSIDLSIPPRDLRRLQQEAASHNAPTPHPGTLIPIHHVIVPETVLLERYRTIVTDHFPDETFTLNELDLLTVVSRSIIRREQTVSDTKTLLDTNRISKRAKQKFLRLENRLGSTRLDLDDLFEIAKRVEGVATFYEEPFSAKDMAGAAANKDQAKIAVKGKRVVGYRKKSTTKIAYDTTTQVKDEEGFHGGEIGVGQKSWQRPRATSATTSISESDGSNAQ